MLKWLFNIFKITEHGDLSKHRLHSTKYEDLCK
jgi:hypothetical protein